MGIHITFKFGNIEFSDKIDLAEARLLETGAEQAPKGKAAYRLIFGDNVDGVTRHVPCNDILNAIDVLSEMCQGKIRGFVYSVVVPAGYVLSGVSSGVGGLRVGDATYGILCGFDQCTLVTFKRNSQGEWVKIAEEDAREMPSITTDNLGVVKIRRRAVPSRLLNLLKRIRKRLTPLDGNTLIGITVG